LFASKAIELHTGAQDYHAEPGIIQIQWDNAQAALAAAQQGSV